MFDHAPTSETKQFDANGRAAAIASDLGGQHQAG